MNDVYMKGGDGAESLAKLLLKYQTEPFRLLYENRTPLKDKIDAVCTKLFHAGGVEYSDEALEKLELYQKYFSDYPICIAKTQYSLSDSKRNLGYPKDFTVVVRDLKVSSGAEFIVVYLGNILLMPGLPSTPAALQIDVNDQEEIVGIY